VTAAYFTTLLQNHDWFYARSDDQAAYQRGLHQAGVIRRAVRDNPELQPVLDAYVKDHVKWGGA
jgi:hypothetical protein